MTVTPPFTPRIVDLDSVPHNRRRGGDLRAVLTPSTAGATSGFMGIALVGPGERIAEHYHPYSEEFVYVVCGALEVDLDGRTHSLHPDQGLMIPAHVRHRFRNVGDTEARMVFHLGPLAPRPELGHVDTEPPPEAAERTTPGRPAARSTVKPAPPATARGARTVRRTAGGPRGAGGAHGHGVTS